MFSFFKKVKKEVVVKDKVWLSAKYKLQHLIARMHQDPSLLCVVWHRQTLEELEKLDPSEDIKARLLMPQQATKQEAGGRTVIFADHHPSFEKELKAYKNLGLKEVEVYTSLDEEFLEGILHENFADLMRKIGMNEDEPIEHPMVSSSIRKAQDKYASLNPIL